MLREFLDVFNSYNPVTLYHLQVETFIVENSLDEQCSEANKRWVGQGLDQPTNELKKLTIYIYIIIYHYKSLYIYIYIYIYVCMIIMHTLLYIYIYIRVCV